MGPLDGDADVCSRHVCLLRGEDPMKMPKLMLFRCSDDMVHWAYPLFGKLTVCGVLDTLGHDRVEEAPTCVRCIAMVQAKLEGDLTAWRVNTDPTKKLG